MFVTEQLRLTKLGKFVEMAQSLIEFGAGAFAGLTCDVALFPLGTVDWIINPALIKVFRYNKVATAEP